MKVIHHQFTNFDDNVYVSENQHIQKGLNLDSIKWAFTTPYAGNWQPLTWLSYIVDYKLFGSNPAWYHLVNLLLHIANTILLFSVLNAMTAALWRSAFVAAAFALHPLHVESVAWVAERKDVLSALFWMLTLAAYIRFVRRSTITSYLLTLLLFALGLMAKPMLVTLPFILLLLDYWPLNRIQNKKDIYRLVVEKIPFFVLSATSSAATFFIQRAVGAMKLVDVLPLNIRLANVVVSYVKYIGKMFWPTHLAVFYPFDVNSLSAWKVVFAVLLLSAISIWVVRLSPKYKFLLTGWAWYLGTLVPVIGLVHVGEQAIADRYTYIPLTGLFIIVAWGADELLTGRQWRKITLPLSASAVILALSVCTFLQLRYWRSSITLFQHAIAVTSRNYIAYNNLGTAYGGLGRYNDEIDACMQAIKIKPDNAIAYNNLGIAYGLLGQFNRAIEAGEQAVRIKPDYAKAYYNLASAYCQVGRYNEAAESYIKAINFEPDYAPAYCDLGYLYGVIGKYNEAIDCYRKAMQLKPDWPLPMAGLAKILATHPDINKRNIAEAIKLAERAAELTKYQNTVILDTLATAYAAGGQFDKAVKTAEKALSSALAEHNEVLARQIRRQLENYKKQSGQ
jgi:tetratricopeptide (TPR) repeat protein